MTHTCRWRLFGKIAFLLVTAMLFVRPSMAQKDLQIIVNGPWSYIHQGNRLYLVAPGNSSHGVYIYSGVDPSQWIHLTPLSMPGSHTIDFASGTYQAGTRPVGSNGQIIPMAKSLVCASAPSNIPSVIANTGNPNFVISLPFPDKFSTFEDSNYVWDGYSESKVDPMNPVGPATLQGLYTTTMVLHYWVRTVPNSLNWNGNTISTLGPDGIAVGITIAAADRGGNSCNNVCDNVSLMSVSERNALFQITQYTLFPSVLDMAGHQSHHYNYNCSSSYSQTTETAIEKASKGDLDNKLNPFCATSVGSADCHTCQMSINGAVPAPTP